MLLSEFPDCSLAKYKHREVISVSETLQRGSDEFRSWFSADLNHINGNEVLCCAPGA